MCTYSMIVDHHFEKWNIPITTPLPNMPPFWPPVTIPTTDPVTNPLKIDPVYTGPTKEQFQELIDLLKMAKKIDKATDQPDCELESKKELLRKIAKELGIEVELP
jgi:hypothetical protein